MNRIEKSADLLGRILLVTLFALAGIGKIGNYAGTQAYMASAGVPGALLPLVIALEIGGALAIIAGWQTRITAFLLAGFSLLAGALFHHDFANQTDQIMLLKDIAIAGGFLLLVARGAGPLSLDARRTTS